MLLLEHTCDIARSQRVGNNGRRAMTDIYTGVRCLALPMDARTTIQNSFELGRGYDFYFDVDQDVLRGDRLTFKGDEYVVSGLERFETALASHLHVMAQQEVS